MSDDTQAVQALIDTAWQSGGVVQLEARDYVISGLTLPDGATRSLTIRGAGCGFSDGPYAATKGGTRLICGAGVTGLAFNGVAGLYRPTFTIEDLTILGTGDKVNPGGGHGLRIIGGSAVPIVHLKNVTVAWFYGGYGVWLSNCENGSVSNVHMISCDIGFKGDAAYNANSHINLSAQLCRSAGIVIENSESLSFAGGMAQSNEGNGVVLRNVTAAHFAALHLENNNRLNQADSWAILIEGGQGIAFDQCSYIFPRDRVMVRSAARSVRFVGGKNIAAAPAITLDPSVRGCLIDECAPPANVQGVARVVWDGS